MPTIALLDPSSVTLAGGQITINSPATTAYTVDDDDARFGGDFSADETGADDDQFVGGTSDLVYLENSFSFDNNGVTQTIYAIEQAGTLIGYAVQDTGTPLVAGGPVAATEAEVGNVVDTPVGELVFGGPRPPDYEDLLPCFVAGTQIETETGLKQIDEIEIGDRVRTADNGFQSVRWVGHTTVAGQGALAPVRISKGALGNSRDLLVSQNHRMLLNGRHFAALFDEPTALVPARMLINDTTIRRAPMDEVTYYHVMLDTHEIIYAEGCPSETFHPGQAEDAISKSTRAEILTLFPELEGDLAAYGPSARCTLTPLDFSAIR